MTGSRQRCRLFFYAPTQPLANPARTAGLDPVAQSAGYPATGNWPGPSGFGAALPILLETFSRLAYNRRIMVRIAKNDYLTTQQAAAAIGCTDSLVRRLRRQGEFPGAIQFSARVFLFPKKEVVKVAKSPNKLGRPRKNSA